MGDALQRAEQQHADARAFAPTLVGLPVQEAVARAEREGFLTQVVGDAMTAEIRLGRIRVRADAAGTVIDAWAN